MKTLLLSIFVICACALTAQVIVSEDAAATPHPSSMLHLDSDDKGFLVPRMDLGQRKSLVTPAEGLWVYQTTDNPGHFVYTNGAWSRIDKERKLIGRMLINETSRNILPGSSYHGGYPATGANGYAVTQIQKGDYQVTFSVPFATPPIVQLTSKTLPPAGDGSGTTSADYCAPVFTAQCTTPLFEDVIAKVRFTSCPNGSCLPLSDPECINDILAGGCQGGSDNYVDFSNIPGTTFEGTAYGNTAPFGNPASDFNLMIASTDEWGDDLYAYIDWGQDGSFEEPEDFVFFREIVQQTPFGPLPIYGQDYNEIGITVPASAINGKTIMRARTIWNSTTVTTSDVISCQTYPFGETQDYRIIVVEANPDNDANPRASGCNLSVVTTTGFRVNCIAVTSGDLNGTAFDFYASDN